MIETKAKARHQRKVSKGKGVRKAKRKRSMVEIKAKAWHSEKGSQSEGCRKAKREKSMVETKAKARHQERFPNERVYEQQREKRAW
jgi:hypothetical protein